MNSFTCILILCFSLEYALTGNLPNVNAGFGDRDKLFSAFAYGEPSGISGQGSNGGQNSYSGISVNGGHGSYSRQNVNGRQVSYTGQNVNGGQLSYTGQNVNGGQVSYTRQNVNDGQASYIGQNVNGGQPSYTGQNVNGGQSSYSSVVSGGFNSYAGTNHRTNTNNMPKEILQQNSKEQQVTSNIKDANVNDNIKQVDASDPLGASNKPILNEKLVTTDIPALSNTPINSDKPVTSITPRVGDVICPNDDDDTSSQDESKCSAIESKPWSYQGKSNGPKMWKKDFPKCCGSKQSPIDIDSSAAESNSQSMSLKFQNYNKDVTDGEIENDGHVFKVTPKDSVDRSIEFKGETYKLKDVFLHINEDMSKSSEHSIDGKKSSLEVQFLHKSLLGKTVIVAVLYTAKMGDPNYNFSPLNTIASKVSYQGQKAKLEENLSLKGIMPDDLSEFYVYEGSLTRPPCDEGITWIILKNKKNIGLNQRAKFLKIHAVKESENNDDEACTMKDTTRPLQPLNGREVILGKSK